MTIKLPTKFADRNIDAFINTIYEAINLSSQRRFHFDFTEVEYIGNQELLVLSGLLKSFIESGIEFEIEFFKKGLPLNEVNDRVKRQIIQFWEVWKIWTIIPNTDYYKYFGIDGNSVQRLQNELKYFPKLSELYSRHGVTPFVSLDYINNYNETDVQNLIKPIYKLNSVIKDLLKSNKCHHPFTSNLLSTIVTEELYLNFLDHSISSTLKGVERLAFMSISFRAKMDEKKIPADEIQKRKEQNFVTECLPETKSFYYNAESSAYKNEPYIEFSFLDFGNGIARTLEEQYCLANPKRQGDIDDSEILKFAFNHDSSRHPILSGGRVETNIPRGLYDALTIIRRYKGLIVIRSNSGKILFDFSTTDDPKKAFAKYGKDNTNFPGTLISLYIPALPETVRVNESTIKPEIDFRKVKPENKKYVSINGIAEQLKVGKDNLYTQLLREVKAKMTSSKEPALIFLSFKSSQAIEPRIIKKIIYFLLSDYAINHLNNVIIVNPPDKAILKEISTEILLLNTAIKNYKLHPLPIVDYNPETTDLSISWLGVYDDDDRNKLNDLLYDHYSIARSDFNDPANITGHLSDFDNHGNLISNFPSREELLKFYLSESLEGTSKEVERLLVDNNCIKKDDQASLYLCSGNYYQKEYIELHNLLNDRSNCQIVSELLFERIKMTVVFPNDFQFIGLTTASHKLLKSFEAAGLISNDDYITIDSYYNFESDLNGEIVDSNKKYILVCDVISTGFLTQQINNKLAEFGTEIAYVAVLVSALDFDYDATKTFIEDFDERIIYLHQYSIKKFKRGEIKNELLDKEIIRINPHTNIPVTLSIEETNFQESIIFPSTIGYDISRNEISIKNRFLDSVEPQTIHVGFLKFNNVIHPYFFNTNLILNTIDLGVLKEIFVKIDKPQFAQERLQIFYPRKSGIENFDFQVLKDVLSNHTIEEVEIERFGTTEGWRFPHNTDYLSSKIEDTFCFIVDDGSCTGDSIIQMIDEISFYHAKEIVLLCFIGRVNDHKREFFSRLSEIKVKDGRSIPISIYFASHWHIPTYYLDENPNIKETTWLNQVINLQNTPYNIKKIAINVIAEIKPKPAATFQDYKYLPKLKGTKDIPKKELLLVREELGKVIGYRLYKESFKFFDYFIKKYEIQKSSKDRYKEIELLCATFIFEPYLYDRLNIILPDVIEKIEDFVRVLITPLSTIYNLLTYEWNKKDIVHLFFIVFKDEKLIKELTIDNFKRLLDFTQRLDSTTNYVLYKLLRYFPLSSEQFAEKKFDSQIRALIFQLKEDPKIPNKEIRKYYNFITSLASRKDFKSQVAQLKENYAKHNEPEYHDLKKSFNHNVSLLIVTIRDIITDIKQEKPLQQSRFTTVKKSWFTILDFINPILSFSGSFRDFLTPYTFFELTSQTDRLRHMVGYIEDIILTDNENINDIEKLNLIKEYVVKIQSDFESNSIFNQLVDNIQSNLSEPIEKLTNEMRGIPNVILNNGVLPSTEFISDIPQLYMDKLVISELVTNMKKYIRRETRSIVSITYKVVNQDYLEMKISNRMLQLDSMNSNGEGTKCLKLLSESPIFGFRYHALNSGDNHIQTLTFKLN